ncbi:hypothetical protein C8J57DRAFT_504704 [Mycena rebaudengoi]|nr:hypothetical protein C8J57DRAFT_504704 [Mycena rebaudengoi]
MKFQQKATEQQEAAVAAAIEKVKSETQDPNAASLSDDLIKKHADELQALQNSLAAKHAAELKAAVDAARAENSGSSPAIDKDAIIAAAIAEHDKELEKTRGEELAAAVERGRLEGGAKAKLKDAQLVRAQKKVKDLEAQILGWQKEGLVPTPSIPAPTASTSTLPASTTSTPTGPASTTTPDTTLPTKPGAARGGAPARGGTPNAPRGNAAPRGGPVRGRGTALSIRGGAARVPPVAPAPAATPAAGVSIMGAAKRPREEGTPPDDSLAKRLKPAEPGTKPPVTLRRPPPAS